MKIPVHVSEVPSEIWYEGTDREIRGKPLCDIGGEAKVGVGYLELPPGSHTKPGHWHSKEEEHLYVLSGRATLHLGSDRFSLRAGSEAMSAFPPVKRSRTICTTPAARPSPTS